MLQLRKSLLFAAVTGSQITILFTAASPGHCLPNAITTPLSSFVSVLKSVPTSDDQSWNKPAAMLTPSVTVTLSGTLTHPPGATTVGPTFHPTELLHKPEIFFLSSLVQSHFHNQLSQAVKLTAILRTVACRKPLSNLHLHFRCFVEMESSFQKV